MSLKTTSSSAPVLGQFVQFAVMAGVVSLIGFSYFTSLAPLVA